MPNLWRQFEALLPTSPLLLGHVEADHQDGTVTVQLLGGGVMRAAVDGGATNSIGEGKRVFMRGGRVLGEAPDLPSFEIEI